MKNDNEEIMALSHLVKASTNEMMKLNASLQESEQRYKSLFDHNPDLIYSMDLAGVITSVNASLTRLLGYRQQEVLKTSAITYVLEADQLSVINCFNQSIHERPQSFTAKLFHKKGYTLEFCITNLPIIVNGEVVGVYGIGKNVTKQKEAEEKIAHLAFHDLLTGLPNRNLFEQHLDKCLRKTVEAGEKTAVIFIDLDQFKMVNESLGHQAGDQFLKYAAKQMKKRIGRQSMLSRYAGDEFMLVINGLSGAEEAGRISRKLSEALAVPLSYHGQEFVLTASMGISIYPDDGLTSDVLIKNAGIALHRAKEKGRGEWEFFKGEMNEFKVERLTMESFLRHAISKDELSLYFQPQISLDDGKVIALEALVRWNHPRLGIVSPGLFIPLAEETGLIGHIGRWVLNEACRQLKKWHETINSELSISVNVSGRQFQKLDFVYEVKEALQRSKIDPRFLHLELTESMMVENVQYGINIMRELKELGIKISIDDFGTGYSSLSYLKDFPIDILKIDQSFIRNLSKSDHNSTDAAIVRAIITMCKGLSVTALAEGVETKQQLLVLKDYGCDHVQGFFIGKPVCAAEVENLFHTYHTKSS